MVENPRDADPEDDDPAVAAAADVTDTTGASSLAAFEEEMELVIPVAPAAVVGAVPPPVFAEAEPAAAPEPDRYGVLGVEGGDGGGLCRGERVYIRENVNNGMVVPIISYITPI